MNSTDEEVVTFVDLFNQSLKEDDRKTFIGSYRKQGNN